MNAPTAESFWIEESTLLAGRYPHAGTVPALVAAGVTLFVDLTDPVDRHPPYEQLLADGVRRTSVPFADFTAGTEESVARALDAIDGEIALGGLPYVHCLGGCGRTGTVIGCRLVRHGLSPEDAMAHYREASAAVCGGRCPEVGSQREMIRAWRSEQ